MDILKGKEFWFKVTNRQKEILNGMQASKISEVHSDGDLTFHAKGKVYVLTTDGGLFVEISPLHVEHYDPVPRPHVPKRRGPLYPHRPATKR